MAPNATLVETVETLKVNLDQLFLLTMALVVLFMQCGFAFLEAGAVRSKNSTNILMKTLLDFFISSIGYYVCGYAFAFGDPSNPFIGHWHFASVYLSENRYAFFIFQYALAATTTAIVSGSMAERTNLTVYPIYTFLLSAFVYPVVSHWSWASGGWLAAGGVYVHDEQVINVAYQDFAGSGVVHAVGGSAAMVAAYLLGPRSGRFTPEGHVRPIKGHSVPLTALGGFILLFGFLALNGGSQARISRPGDGQTVALAAKNTILSGSASALAALTLKRLLGMGQWSVMNTINSALTGMVAISAGCNVFYPWASVVVGVVAATTFLIWSWIMVKLRIDDPLDAVAVHLGGGIWGVVAVAIFQKKSSVIFSWGTPAFLSLGWQFCGVLAIIAWTSVTCAILFGVLRAFGILRVSEDVEKAGLDSSRHGNDAGTVAPQDEWTERDVEAMDYIVQPAKCDGKMANVSCYDNRACDDVILNSNWSMTHKTPTVTNDASTAVDGVSTLAKTTL